MALKYSGQYPAISIAMCPPPLRPIKKTFSLYGRSKGENGMDFRGLPEGELIEILHQRNVPAHVMQLVGDSIEEGCLTHPQVSTDNDVHSLREGIE